MRLGTNIEQLNADFESVTGAPFEHFYCPILHVDEDVPLAEGHVVPESLGGSSRVLQRADVDKGFGSFFEAEAADAILQGIEGNPLDTVLGGASEDAKKVTRRFRFRMGFPGREQLIKASYRNNDDGVGRFVVSTDELRDVLGEPTAPSTLEGFVGVELDARSSILVTSLRAIHLAWFQICGYGYVFSPEGRFVASVLRGIYEKFILPRRGTNRTKRGSLVSDRVKEEVDAWCLQFHNLIRPLPAPLLDELPDEIVQSTPDTGWFMALWDGDGRMYGWISVVRLGEQHIGVMTPLVFDARGMALIGLSANWRLNVSVARFSPESQMMDLAPPPHRVFVWPSADREALGLPAISIEQGAQKAIDEMTKMGDGFNMRNH